LGGDNMHSTTTPQSDTIDERVDGTPPRLRLRNVVKRFGGVVAVNNVSFEVRPGEVVGLVGDNGAGKSTIVKMISGVHQPTEGTIELDGEPISFTSPKQAITSGVETVYQDLGLIDQFDIAGNFFLGRELVRGGFLRPLGILRRREMAERSIDAVTRLKIKIPGRRQTVQDMSGGQRQAVGIGRAAFWGGKLLLLDEPTAALGVEESGEVMALIREMAGSTDIGMIVISHNLEHIWAVCDRIVVMRQGVMAADVRKEDVDPDRVVALITGAAKS
jgi:ABC-type sugar transport system ATPase subunit